MRGPCANCVNEQAQQHTTSEQFPPARELAVWLRAVRCYFNHANQPLTESERANISARNFKSETRVVRDALMRSLQVRQEAQTGLLEALVRRDFVGLEHELAGNGLSGEAAELLLDVPQRRGGPEVLTDAPTPAVEAVTGMRRVYELLEPGVAERVIFDLGLVRNIGYYTGAVFDVYDPALGAPIGGGGRYDELLGRFGRSLPAVGFALGVDRLHMALAGEERGTGALLARATARVAE